MTGRRRHVGQPWPTAGSTSAQAHVIAAAIDALPQELDPELRIRGEAHLVEQATLFGPRELRRLGGRLLEAIAPDIADQAEYARLVDEERRAHAATKLTSAPWRRVRLARVEHDGNMTVCQPVAPSGSTSASAPVCTRPFRSVARTRSTCSPSSRLRVVVHCTQLSMVSALPISADCHAPPSRLTSTALMPVCCDHATPPTRCSPVPIVSPPPGTSMRDDIFTGACSAQPLSIQYAEMSSKRVTSMSTTHLHADT